MLKIEKTSKRKYTIFNEVGEEKKEIINLDLMFSPITNKFEKLSEYIEDCSLKIGEPFDKWFIKFLTDYKKSEYDYAVVKRNIKDLMKFSDKYLDLCEINFNDYINKSKVSKNSIFFDADEIKKIIQVSNYLKLFTAIDTLYYHLLTFSLLIPLFSTENLEKPVLYWPM